MAYHPLNHKRIRSNPSLLYVLVLDGHFLHQGLVVEQLEGVHLFAVLLSLLVGHLGQQHVLVLLMDILQILILLLLVVVEGLGVLFPDHCLLLVNLLLFDLFLSLLLNLPAQVLPHLLLLDFGGSFFPLLLFLFLSELVFNMPHHLVVFRLDLFLLILDDRVCEGGHHRLNLILSLSLLVVSLPLQLVLQSAVLFLSFNVLNKK